MLWAASLVILLVILPCCVRCQFVAALRQGSFSFELRLLGLRLAGNKKSSKRSSYEHKKHPELSGLLRYGDELLKLVPRFLEKLRLERLKIDFLSAFSDPFETVMAYDLAGTLFTALMAKVGEHMELHNDLDFEAGEPRLEAELRASLPLGRTLLLTVAALRGRKKLFRAAEKG